MLRCSWVRSAGGGAGAARGKAVIRPVPTGSAGHLGYHRQLVAVDGSGGRVTSGRAGCAAARAGGRPPGKVVPTGRLRRLFDLLAAEAILADEERRQGGLPPWLAAMLGRQHATG